MARIVVIDKAGKANALKAGRIEIELEHGRQVVIEFPPLAWGDLSIEAQSASGDPVLNLQPSACNLLTLRVDVHHDFSAVDEDGVPPVLPAVGLQLDIQRALKGEDRALPRPRKRQLRRWIEAVLAGSEHVRAADVTVRLVGRKEGRALNCEFRGKDYATNVLTFAYDDVVGGEGGKDLLRGDLVLCVPVVIEEAARQGKLPIAHYAHLVVHGMLHLIGLDHEADDEADYMEACERAVLGQFGFADPYAGERSAPATPD